MGKFYCKVEHKWCKHCKKNACIYNHNRILLNDIGNCPIREERKTISFQQLLRDLHVEDIVRRIIELYPDQDKNADGYRKVYNECINMKAPRWNMKSYLYIHHVVEEPDDMFRTEPTEYDDITERVIGEPYTYAIEMCPWNFWMSLMVDKETIDNYLPLDVAAHGLWEMTWTGFTQDSPTNFRKNLDKNFEECKENLKSDK